MSEFDVYEDDMPESKFSDRDVERLISGRMPEDETLAILAPLNEVLRADFVRTPSDDAVERFAASAAEIARSARPDAPTTTTPETVVPTAGRFRMALKRRMATALAAVVLLSGMTGVAVAANGAAPGQGLYWFDQVMERVGILDGGAAERIAEAQALFADGLVAQSVEHAAAAADAAGAQGAEEATEALLTAAEQLRANEDGSDHAVEVRDRVADMLDYMATTEDTGSDFGHGVAALARGISDQDDAADAAEDVADEADEAAEGEAEGDEDGGPPEDVPRGPPEDVPPGPPKGGGG